MDSFWKQLQDASQSFFSAFSSQQQEQLKIAFNSLDYNGDGKVSFQELMKELESKHELSADTRGAYFILYSAGDINNDGQLDFNEAKPLLYAMFICCVPICDACRALPMEDSYYTCTQCIQTDVNRTYDLCCSCYHKGRACHHEHFRFHKMLTLAPKWHLSPLLREYDISVRCESCKENHSIGAKPVLFDSHMQSIDGVWLCEFCAVWMCSVCQNKDWTDSSIAEDGLWTQALTCSKCTNQTSTAVLSIDRARQRAELCNCNSCSSKARANALTVSFNPLRPATSPATPTGGSARREVPVPVAPQARRASTSSRATSFGASSAVRSIPNRALRHGRAAAGFIKNKEFQAFVFQVLLTALQAGLGAAACTVQ